MQLADLDSVIRVHLSSFTGFFLSSMGTRFLKEFYKAALLDESSIALVSQQDNRISGLVVGTTQPSGFYRRVIRGHWHQFLLASTRLIVRKPQTILRLLWRLLITRNEKHYSGEALLMSIAVNPSDQGKGTGKQLVDRFIEEASRRGAASISLTTDAINNKGVNEFYLRSGFDCSSSFMTPEGRQMNEYRRVLRQ
ncbi:MAG TPA: GNAT family N-acetyltransferase [Anaerolineales bacterium]|jgi:GNAT superfamily N-acetyltransferase|nr:GNAT family N-acetyltransferase [Anaerolineales bacterium]